MTLVPALTLWVLVQNCTCPLPYNFCHRPTQYTSPIVCAHRGVTNITKFLEVGTKDSFGTDLETGGGNTTNPPKDCDKGFPVHPMLTANLILTGISVILSLAHCTHRTRDEAANRRAGFHRLLPRRRAIPRPDFTLGRPRPEPATLPTSVPPLAVRMANQHIAKATAILEGRPISPPVLTGQVAKTVETFEQKAGSSTSTFF